MKIPTPQEIYALERERILRQIIRTLNEGVLNVAIRCGNAAIDTRVAIEKELLAAGWIIDSWYYSMNHLSVHLKPKPKYGTIRRVGWLRRKEVYTEDGWVAQ